MDPVLGAPREIVIVLPGTVSGFGSVSVIATAALFTMTRWVAAVIVVLAVTTVTNSGSDETHKATHAALFDWTANAENGGIVVTAAPLRSRYDDTVFGVAVGLRRTYTRRGAEDAAGRVTVCAPARASVTT